MRQFVDTNVLIYAADASAGAKQVRAAELLDRLWREEAPCASVQVLEEFHHNVTRKLPRPLSAAESLAKVQYYSAWPIFAPSAQDVAAAISLQMLHRLNFWDALIVPAALALRCGILWTEDLHHGMRFGDLAVQNPFA